MSGTQYEQELIATANAIAAPGKGILAADESTGTIGKRFQSINLDNTEDNRRAYRQLLFPTPGLGQYISGCIMFEETLYQKTSDGKCCESVSGRCDRVCIDTSVVHSLRRHSVCGHSQVSGNYYRY